LKWLANAVPVLFGWGEGGTIKYSVLAVGSYLISATILGRELTTLLVLAVAGIAIAIRILAKTRCNADITADLQAGVLRIPVHSDKERSITEYRTVPQSEAICFGVKLHPYSSEWEVTSWILQLHLTSGESIPVAVYKAGGVVNDYGVQILAYWLNEQLGLRQPVNLEYLAPNVAAAISPAESLSGARL
jgi:hypothetical protein